MKSTLIAFLTTLFSSYCYGQTYEISDSYFGQASLELKNKNYDRALALLEKSLQSERISTIPRQDRIFNILWSAANASRDDQNYQKALTLGEESLFIVKKLFGENHAEYRKVLGWLASLYNESEDGQKARSTYQELLENIQYYLGKDHPDYGIAANALGRLYYLNDEYSKAMPLFLEAVDNAKINLKLNDLEFNMRLGNLARVYIDGYSDYEKAERLYLQALQNTENIGGTDHIERLKWRNNLGLIYRDKKQYDLALPIFLELIDSSEKSLGKDHSFYGTYLNNLGLIFQDLKQFDKALPVFLEAVENTKMSLGEHHRDYQKHIQNLGRLYIDLRQYEKALTTFSKAQEIAEKVFGRNSAENAGAHRMLSVVQSDLKNFDRALASALLALEITTTSIGKESQDYADCLDNVGYQHYRLKNYLLAVPFYEESLRLTEKLSGKNNDEYITRLDMLQYLNYQLSYYSESLVYGMEVRTLSENFYGKKSKEYIESLYYLALAYQKTNQLEVSQTLFLELLEISGEISGKDSVNYRRYLEGYSWLSNEMKNYDIAIANLLKNLEITKQSKGENSVEYAESLYNLGVIYYNANLYDKALPTYLESVRVTEKQLGRNNNTYRKRYSSLAILYSDMGEDEKAINIQLDLLKEIKNRNESNGELFIALSTDLHRYYIRARQFENALINLQSQLSVIKLIYGENHIKYGYSLKALSFIHASMGNIDKSLPILKDAFIIAEKNRSNDNNLVTAIQIQMALLYLELGQNNKVDELLTDLNNIEIDKRVYSEELLYDLSELYELVEKKEKSLSIYTHILRILGDDRDINSGFYADILSKTGLLYQDAGQNDKAHSLLKEAVESMEKNFGKDHPFSAVPLHRFAQFYQKNGQNQEALHYLTVAMNIEERTVGKKHPKYYEKLLSLASLHREMGAIELALPLFLENLKIIQDGISSNFTILSEREKESFIKTIEQNFHISQSFFADYYHHDKSVAEASYDIELLTKGLILKSSQQMRYAIENGGVQNATNLYQQWLGKKLAIAKQYALPIGARYAAVKDWEAEADDMEKELIKLSASFSELSTLGKTTWRDVQSKLTQNEVAIEFSTFKYKNKNEWTDETHYTALIVNKNSGQPLMIKLFEQKEIDKLLKTTGNDDFKVNSLYRGAIGNASKNEALSKLYDLIWKPLEKHIQLGQEIYFAPSGTLHQIAFSAIETPDGRVLSDLYELNQLSSTAKITQPQKQPSLQNIALFGGIDYDARPGKISDEVKKITEKNPSVSRSLREDLTRGGSWSYLKGTRSEVENIASEAKKSSIRTEIFSGKHAIEENYKTLNGGNSPDILHIATHGFFFPDSEKTNIENISLNTSEYNLYKVSDNPLNRAGLLFTGANAAWAGESISESVEDGILTAYEVSHVPLPNTKLVVLSACETGLGEIKGSEGVFGLQRAFKSAGVEYLLMSLWQVPDAETAEFMEEFYKNLFTIKDIEDSFALTQNYMKKKYSKDPYKWAAFVLMR